MCCGVVGGKGFEPLSHAPEAYWKFTGNTWSCLNIEADLAALQETCPRCHRGLTEIASESESMS